MKSNGIFKLSADVIRIIIVVLGSIFATLVLSFSVLAIIKIQEQDLDTASTYLLLIFIVLALSRLVTFFKERTKTTLIRFAVLFVFDVVLGIIIYFGKDHPYLYSLCGGLFCLTIILSRAFKLVQDHSIRSLIFNLIIITIAVLLAIGLFMPQKDDIFSPVLIVCVIVAITAFLEVLSTAMSQLKFRTLFKIIIRTYALEIILGLFTMMIASALVFMYYEESIGTFANGLWYAFAVVTTIGFGDFAAQTVIGRIVTVLLGIYGIIVVAVITSIIVNFYNETAGKKDTEHIKEVRNEENKKK